MDLLRASRGLRLALLLALLVGVLNIAVNVLVALQALPRATESALMIGSDVILIGLAVAALLRAFATERIITREALSSRELLRQAEQSEAALRDSESRFRLLAANVPAAISLVGRDLRYRYANERYREWLGIEPQAVVGRHMQEIIGTKAFERGYPHMQAALGGEPQTFENILQGHDGVTIPVLVNFVPYVVGDRVDGFYILRTDISALKAAEENLRMQARETSKQLAEIEAIYDTARIGLAVLDTEGRFLRVNQRMAEINGIPVEGHVGRSLRDVVPEMADAVQGIIKTVLETQTGVLDVELSGETAAQPGVTRQWVEQWLPLRDADGQIFAVNVVVEEVTELRRYQKEQDQLLSQVLEQRRRAEDLAQALQEERDILETIMENTRTQLAYLDPTFNFVRVNSAYAEGARLSREELIGRNHFSLFPDEENEAIFEHVWRTGQPAEYRGRVFEHADQPDRGASYWDWTLVPVKNPGGFTQGLVFSLTDVTEQKRAEEVLRRARDELEQAVRSRTRALTVAIEALDEENTERRRVEAQLRLILDQIPAILWTTDDQLRYTSIQGAGMQSLGLHVEALLGQSIVAAQASLAADSAVTLDAHQRALTGESVTFQASWGGLFHEGYVEALRDAGGSVTGCIGVALDITRRHAAEEALRASETRFRAFFANAPVAVALQDPSGRIIEANPALENLLGASGERLQALTWSDFVHPEDVETDFELFQDMLSGKLSNYQVEKRLLPRTGDQRWVRLTVSVARDLSGLPYLIVSMAEDITEAKSAARELAEREQQYRSIFEATSDGLVITDLEGQIVDINPAAITMSGYTRSEVAQLRPSDFIARERRESFRRLLALVRDSERLEIQTLGQRRDGSQFDLELRASRFVYRGEPHLLSMVRDITERVRSIQLLEARVKERTRELSTLLEVSRSISATLEQRPLLALVADQIQRLLPAASILLYVLDEDRLTLAEHRGFSRDMASDERIDLSDPQVLEEARRQDVPYVASNLSSEPGAGFAGRIYDRMRALMPLARSAVWAPLCVKGRVVGGLGVVDNEAGRFAARDAELLATIANQAAVALDNAQLYEQAQELAILQERQRLARELHDSVTQALYSLVLMTEATRRLLMLEQTERLATFLGRIAETAQQVLKEMRLLVYELRPTVLARDGLISAVRQRLQTVEGRAGVDAQLLVTGNAYIPEQIEGELYRVAQEALNNSLKHSGATSVVVRLDLQPASACLKITDNGRGFEVEKLGEGGMGLTSMKERAHRLGGRLDLTSVAGQGTTVCLEIPLVTIQENEVKHGRN
jgi:PAS domain S-box-containing protein